jgi:hypothetical protein
MQAGLDPTKSLVFIADFVTETELCGPYRSMIVSYTPVNAGTGGILRQNKLKVRAPAA